MGLGYLGRIHAQIYRKLPQADLVGFAEINQIRLKQQSDELRVAGFADYSRLFDKVEAVSIATPTITHYKIAADFLKHQIPILVEKPFTATLTQADKLIKLAKKGNSILQVGHVERFNSAFIAVQKIIQNPRFIECHRLSPFSGRSQDIGVVLDLMIHDIDIILGLAKSPVKRIEATGINVITHFEDIANARITFENGCVANLTASRVSEEAMRKIRIFFKNTYISLDYKGAQAHLYKKTPQGLIRCELPIEKEPPLEKELRSFLECVLQKRKPVIGPKEATAALSCALKIQKKIWKRKSSLSPAKHPQSNMRQISSKR